MSYAAWSVSFAEQPSASKWNILGTNDAYFNSILTGTGTIGALVLGLSAALDATNGVKTQANAGTGGGTMYYINLGGIKLCWGKIASQNVGTGGATWTVTLPTSFFSTIQASLVTIDTISVEPKQHAYVSAISTVTLTIGQISDTNGATQVDSFLIIGT